MNTSQLFRFAGWSAYVNAVAIIISFVSLSVFFAVGGLWGRAPTVAFLKESGPWGRREVDQDGHGPANIADAYGLRP
jgi:hypothetical protein